MVNIKYLNINSRRSRIVTKVETSSRQERTTVEYKVDMGSDGNLMPLK